MIKDVTCIISARSTDSRVRPIVDVAKATYQTMNTLVC